MATEIAVGESKTLHAWEAGGAAIGYRADRMGERAAGCS
jgi:hypothetical protein